MTADAAPNIPGGPGTAAAGTAVTEVGDPGGPVTGNDLSAGQMGTGIQPGMPVMDPNQVTTKPRQMPSDGQVTDVNGPQDPTMGMDPAANGADGTNPGPGTGGDADAGADDGTDQGQSAVAAIARDVLASNPRLSTRQAIRIAARAYHQMGGARLAVVALSAPDRPDGRGEPRPPVRPAAVPLRHPDSPMTATSPGQTVTKTEPYHHFGEGPASLVNDPSSGAPMTNTLWESRT